MNIHEYQAKAFFRRFDIPTPEGDVAFSPKQAKDIALKIGSFPVAIKAQIHAGGRGKGGGVKLADSADQAESMAEEIIGMNLVTPQTGPEGKRVRKVLVEKGLDIKKELYVGMLLDRQTAAVVLMASEAGGMDIEAVAARSPEKILKIHINPLIGIQSFQCRQAAFGLHLPQHVMKQFVPVLKNLYRLFIAYDCLLVEINPLVITVDDSVFVLDAKINFDDNALFRHKDLLECRDIEEEDPLDVEASRFGLNYINLDGNIGNMVNGAGLAMATMDIIKRAGAEPANFLDVGGGASSEKVANGFKIILQDKKVKGIFINIFGGILRCDELAKGVVEAAEKTGINVPVVIRMEGTNVEEGRKILASSGLDLIAARDLKDAAQKVSQLVK
ncbi:MAG: ADP-forming succinate--CoA ligase subunit beta [Deltaproteobacteria bacterium]|nr:ADP-forming succinate--CoA ligase subunit beta [Deltaproteobacteria bacterium]MBW1995356.1 ADP-forming succinate--CoA ligase subunit beta [Deltaproteobacteria bacterium]